MEQKNIKNVRVSDKAWFELKSRALRERKTMIGLFDTLASFDPQKVYDLGYGDGASKKKHKSI